MKIITTKHFAIGCLLASAISMPLSQLGAAELPVFGTNAPPVDFHGFASQGYSWNSGHNDYLGGNSSAGTIDIREYGINGSMVKGKWRVGAQVFAQKLGPYGDDQVKLDWASVDYQATQWFGVRAGRVKMPRGLYNESLDLDSTRPFVLLPQTLYDARLRDFNASFNGGMVYGNVDLPGKLGSIDYKGFYGLMPMHLQSGAVDFFNTAAATATTNAISMDSVVGGSIFWNTPISGLKIGYSVNALKGLDMTKRLTTGVFFHKYTDKPNLRQIISAEYTPGKWTYAAEVGAEDTEWFLTNKQQTQFAHTRQAYGSAARRMNSWLELGTYASWYQYQQQTFQTVEQRDYALTARFDLTDNTLFKIEGHYMRGAGKIYDTPSNPQPLDLRDNSWFSIDAKLSFSF